MSRFLSILLTLAALPVVTFSEDVTFHINGDGVHVMHMPNAHTDGDAIRIRDQVKAGRSLEQVIESKPTAEFDAAWGKGFLTPARFIEMLYKNVQAAR